MKERINQLKQLWRENWKWIVFYFALFFILLCPLPYEIEGPGGVISLTDRIQIANTENKGDFSMVYVSSYKGRVGNMLISLFRKDYDIVSVGKNSKTHERVEDAQIRGKLMLNNANQTAILYAYQKAFKTIDMKGIHLFVSYIDPEAQTNLKVGDELLTVDGQVVENMADVATHLEEKEIGTEIPLTVQKDGKITSKTARIQDIEGRKVIGILLTPNYEYTLDPAIELHFEPSESGSSGGFMMTLAIYQQLIEEDLCKGRKIAGTGTIDLEGNVGEISGIKYKLMGAVQNKMDILFIPKENYAEALQIKQDRNYDIELVKIGTFEEALSYLKNQ